jgi:tetratricopeptide (TPR) repeat protein
VAAWLGAASDGEAVLLVLDDLQWAAKPTLMLVRHVARSAELKGLLLVGTYRDSDLGHNHPLAGVVADLRRQIGLERISLHGLDAAGVAAYMEQAAGHALDGADMGLARAIYEETEGNLFFVKEVLRHLTETGGIRRRDGRWVTGLPIDELGIPEGVRDVVGRRLARLSEAANDLLGIAAVAGVEFELAVLGVAAGLDDDALTVAVDEAMTARLVTDVAGAPGRCRFAHALVRDTLYSDLSGVRRPSLHRRVADAIELLHAGRLEDHLPALVHHYARAGGRRAETLKAVDYAVWAGDRALAQLANDEAVAYYREALDLLSMGDWPVDEPRRLALLISLGEAECRAGDPVHRSTLLEAAALAGERRDASALARAALANTRGLLPTRIGRVDAEKVSVLEAALAAVGDRDLRTRARLLATLGLELVFAGDWRRCLELSDEAVALARSLGDPDTLARVLLARYFPTSVPGLLEDRLANTATLVDTADAVADPALQAEANLLCGRAAMEAGDVERASRCYDLADRLSAGLGQPALRWRVRYVQTAQAIAAGNLLDAETLLGEARDVGRLAGQDGTEWVFAWQLCLLRLEQGRVDEEVVTCLEAARWEHGTPPMDSLLALAACELGRDADAAAEMYRLATAPVAFDIYWLVTMTHWALVAVHLGDTVQASGLESALRPYAGQAIAFSPGPRPSVAHHLGVLSTALGRYQQAERDFAAALTIHERIRAPHWTARTGLEWARMLLTRRQPGDAERARVLLAEALATARELELATLEGQAVQLLQDCP